MRFSQEESTVCVLMVMKGHEADVILLFWKQWSSMAQRTDITGCETHNTCYTQCWICLHLRVDKKKKRYHMMLLSS